MSGSPPFGYENHDDHDDKPPEPPRPMTGLDVFISAVIVIAFWGSLAAAIVCAVRELRR